jgi:diguanylate cyclase (GGDEF)-like protein/PAS domain S-box-containing protein
VVSVQASQHNNDHEDDHVADLLLQQRLSFESAPIGQAVVGLDGTWLAVNPALCRLLGGETSDFEGKSFQDFTHPDDVGTDLDLLADIVEGRILSVSVQKRYLRLDGTIVPVKIQVTAARGEGRTPLFFISQIEDMTDRMANEQALADARDRLASANARFAALVENSGDMMTITDPEGLIMYASPASKVVLGRAPEDTIGKSITTIIHRDDGRHVWPKVHELMSREGNTVRFICRVRHAELGWRHAEITSTNRMEDPNVAGVVSNVRDVTSRVEATERLQHQVMHDPLTGLPNRLLFLERLQQAIVRGKEESTRCAVLFIDLDRFKGINDNLGHGIGDRVLTTVAKRLQNALRYAHSAARLGGDEFVVLAEQVDGFEGAKEAAEQARQAVTEPILVGGQSVTVGCSVGIAVQGDDHTPEALLQEADIAMYRAKEHGRNRSEIYDEAMRVMARRRLDAEQTIRWALDHDRVEVFHQPVFELRTGSFEGTEALVRIRRPDGDLLGAEEFVSVAEDTGLVVPLGESVLRTACADFAAWAAAGRAPRRVSVNVSAGQLFSAELVSQLTDILDETKMTPEQLCLEITETTLIDGGSGALHHVETLKDMGVYLALDDFGTGWSSLAYLRRFPIDVVKIDRSFVAGLGTDKGDTEVVKAVVDLSHSLGLSVVAEGVETAEQERLLVVAGCDYAQGFRYSRPVPAEQIDNVPRELSIIRAA